MCFISEILVLCVVEDQTSLKHHFGLYFMYLFLPAIPFLTFLILPFLVTFNHSSDIYLLMTFHACIFCYLLNHYMAVALTKTNKKQKKTKPPKQIRSKWVEMWTKRKSARLGHGIYGINYVHSMTIRSTFHIVRSKKIPVKYGADSWLE